MTPEEIKELRMSRGWTRKRMAEELHVSEMTIFRWEQGQSKPLDLHAWKLDKLRA